MTREKAKTILHEKMKRPYLFGEINNLIDNIFDDTDSEICDNCIYYHTLGCRDYEPGWFCADFEGGADEND